MLTSLHVDSSQLSQIDNQTARRMCVCVGFSLRCICKCKCFIIIRIVWNTCKRKRDHSFITIHTCVFGHYTHLRVLYTRTLDWNVSQEFYVKLYLLIRYSVCWFLKSSIESNYQFLVEQYFFLQKPTQFIFNYIAGTIAIIAAEANLYHKDNTPIWQTIKHSKPQWGTIH